MNKRAITAMLLSTSITFTSLSLSVKAAKEEKTSQISTSIINSQKVTSDTEMTNLFEENFVEWSKASIDESFLSEGYSYKELYRHKTDDTIDWVLVNAEYNLAFPDVVTSLTVGDRVIMCGHLSSPFICRYGIYDVNDNKFYDLDEIKNQLQKYDGLIEALASLKIGTSIGDINSDGEINMLDVTSLQKIIASINIYDDFGSSAYFVSDFNRDGKNSMLDVTEMQKFIANLNN